MISFRTFHCFGVCFVCGHGVSSGTRRVSCLTHKLTRNCVSVSQTTVFGGMFVSKFLRVSSFEAVEDVSADFDGFCFLSFNLFDLSVWW